MIAAGSAGVVAVPEGAPPPTDESLLAGWSAAGVDRFGLAAESAGLLLVSVVVGAVAPVAGAASVAGGVGDELVAESEVKLAGMASGLVAVGSLAVDEGLAAESGAVLAGVAIGPVAVGFVGVGEADAADVSLGGATGFVGVPAVPIGSLGGMSGMFDGMVRLMPSVVVSGVT